MKITATNKATGEVIELQADAPEQVVDAWRIAQEYEKTAKALKDQLKMLVPQMTGTRGTTEPIIDSQGGQFMFRVSTIQRYTYDKSTMREVLDPDVFDVLLKPDKPAVDKYLKENLEGLGDASTRLRAAMLPEGSPYQVIKLEKVARGE